MTPTACHKVKRRGTILASYFITVQSRRGSCHWPSWRVERRQGVAAEHAHRRGFGSPTCSEPHSTTHGGGEHPDQRKKFPFRSVAQPTQAPARSQPYCQECQS